MRVQDIFFSGIGVYLPEIETVESAVARGLYPAGEVEARGLSGAAVAGDTPAPEMALQAARDALKNSGVSPGDLDALFYTGSWHQGPDGWYPQYYLQRHLVGDDLLSVQISHGCNGTFSSLELGIDMLRADPGRKAVIIAASDNFGTPLFKRWDSGVQNTVMGDAASALVVTKDSGFARLRSMCALNLSDMEELFRCGEPMFPPSITQGRVLDFKPRVEAFVMKAINEGTGFAVLDRDHELTTESATRALADADVMIDDIKKVIVHNWGKAETTACLELMGFPLEKSTWDYGKGIGHTGTSDHMISLHHLLTTGQLEVGDFVMLAGILPGATYKTAVVEILDIPSWPSSSPS